MLWPAVREANLRREVKGIFSNSCVKRIHSVFEYSWLVVPTSRCNKPPFTAVSLAAYYSPQAKIRSWRSCLAVGDPPLGVWRSLTQH